MVILKIVVSIVFENNIIEKIYEKFFEIDNKYMEKTLDYVVKRDNYSDLTTLYKIIYEDLYNLNDCFRCFIINMNIINKEVKEFVNKMHKDCESFHKNNNINIKSFSYKREFVNQLEI